MDFAILIGAVVLLAAVGAAKIGSRLGLPSLLLFLGLGLLLGDSGLGIRFDDPALAHSLGFAALVIILGEGGFTTSWPTIRSVLAPAALLATVGVAVSVGVVATFAHFVIGLPWPASVLVGAILSPTDSAAVFSVLRGLPLPAKMGAVLEGESGLNDAPTVLLVTATASLAVGHGPEGGIPAVIGLIVVELVGGLAIGAAVGVLGVVALRSFALPSSSLFPLATLAWILLSYGLGTWLHMSGFAAVYVAALLLGNAALPHRRATVSFLEGLAWIAQIGLFVMLGLLASPHAITWQNAVESLIIGAVLTFVARPLAVFVCLAPFRVSPRAHVFVSWAGLRGAVPIILATIPMEMGYARAQLLFHVVLVLVVVFTLLQAPTLPWVARRLRLVTGNETSAIDIESAPLDKIRAELLHVRVPEGSKLRGVAVRELRLPRHAFVSVIIRDGDSAAPEPHDRLRDGDELLIVARSTDRPSVEARLRDIERHGRLARWHRNGGGQG